MKKLYFATSNKGKADEASKILSAEIEIIRLELDEIQDLDPKKIVEHKVKQAYLKIRKPVFVDDVSFEVLAWNGFPGPFIKFIPIAGGYELLLKMLKGEKNRKVKVTATIGFHDGKKIHFVQGWFYGKVVPKRGSRGWGFDPYIIPEGYKETFGEMDESLKNKISHRARALASFKELLDSESKEKTI
jgi:non-canonical purine NTP pyrophosphatase (RdgB/HAM1 family)